MKYFDYIKKIDKKILHTSINILRACLILALLSSMILCFYHSTEALFQYELGIAILRVSIIFASFVVVCILGFDKILKDLS